MVCKFSSEESEFPKVGVVGMQQRILIVDNLGGGRRVDDPQSDQETLAPWEGRLYVTCGAH